MIAGLQINLPVFDRNQGAINASDADARAAAEAVAALRNQITSEVGLARREYQMRRNQYVETFQPLRGRAVRRAHAEVEIANRKWHAIDADVAGEIERIVAARFPERQS